MKDELKRQRIIKELQKQFKELGSLVNKLELDLSRVEKR